MNTQGLRPGTARSREHGAGRDGSSRSVASSEFTPPWRGRPRRAGTARPTFSLLLAVTLSIAALADTSNTPTQGGMKAVRPDGTQTAVDLPLKHTEVEAEISGFVTRVKVIQTFSNPHDSPIEAIYVFPLPQDSAVGDMTIRIGDRIIKGQIKKREEAKQIYEAAKQAGQTAALLEQERPNLFTQSVANIMPGNDILVEITYDQVLKYEKGAYEFAFPMVVGPRFIPGSMLAESASYGPARHSLGDGGQDVARISPPVLKPGQRNGHDINITVKLDAGVPIRRLTCPSHDIVITGGETDTVITGPVTISLKPHDTVPNKDFVIRYDVAGEKPEIGFLAHQGELGGYFTLMFQPPERPKPDIVTPKEMVFVVDCSGSMSGEPMALAKKAMRHALKNLNPGDSFQIIRFSESASPFAKTPLENTPENVRRGLSYVNGLSGSGGTMMIEGIKAALDYPHEEGRLRVVCFMTDGYIGNEREILSAIEKKLGDNTRLFSFGVGSSVNRYLLERMGEVGRGEVQYVLLNEKPDKAVEAFYERVRNPVLTHIEVDWAGLDVHEITPARVHDLFTGQPVFLLGRYDKPGRGTIKVQGRSGARQVTYTLPVTLPEHADEHGAVASLWARSRIKELEAEQYGQEDADVMKTVTELALKHRLMSRYTSFVAVEQKVVNEQGTVKTVHVPVEMPDGVSYEGVFGKGDASRAHYGVAAPACFSAGNPTKSFLGRTRKLSAQICGFLPAAGRCEEAKEDTDEPADISKDDAPPVFAIRFALSEAHRLIEITRSGEVWVTESDPHSGSPISRTQKTRLSRKEQRSLWALVARALAQTSPTYRAAVEKGTLTVQQWDAQGYAMSDVVIQLASSGDPEPADWSAVIRRLLKLAE